MCAFEQSEKGMEFEMDKKVRNAVRTYLIENNKVVVIKNKCEVNRDFYDIPGGKIENNESDVDAAKREFKEETGIQIDDLLYKGKAIVEYPDRIYNFSIFIANRYNGKPQEFEENISMWIDIQELLKKEKILPVVKILEYLKDEDIINLNITCDKLNNVLKIEKIFN